MTSKETKKELRVQKPFLKWVGGKTQLLPLIVKKIPKKMENYHDIFLGGGSVLLAVLSLQKQGEITIKKKVYAYDSNIHLIDLFRNIQRDRNGILEHIQRHLDEYKNIQDDTINRNPQSVDQAKTSKESYYYWLRNKFNLPETENLIEKSAIFILLNKLGFRGMYREGPKGFNVPFGHYKTTPEIITKETLDNIYELIKDVDFRVLDCMQSLGNVKRGDFVYLDPPYAPETQTSFVKYTQEGFNHDKHEELFQRVKELKSKKAKFLLHNAAVPQVIEHFSDFTKEEITARRAINPKNPESVAKELIIYS